MAEEFSNTSFFSSQEEEGEEEGNSSPPSDSVESTRSTKRMPLQKRPVVQASSPKRHTGINATTKILLNNPRDFMMSGISTIWHRRVKVKSSSERPDGVAFIVPEKASVVYVPFVADNIPFVKNFGDSEKPPRQIHDKLKEHFYIFRMTLPSIDQLRAEKPELLEYEGDNIVRVPVHMARKRKFDDAFGDEYPDYIFSTLEYELVGPAEDSSPASSPAPAPTKRQKKDGKGDAKSKANSTSYDGDDVATAGIIDGESRGQSKCHACAKPTDGREENKRALVITHGPIGKKGKTMEHVLCEWCAFKNGYRHAGCGISAAKVNSKMRGRAKVKEACPSYCFICFHECVCGKCTKKRKEKSGKPAVSIDAEYKWCDVSTA